MKIALAIRHVAYEDLGLFERTLDAAGYQLRYLEAGMDDLSWIDPLDPDLLIVLGGPISANDEADYPFIQDELEIIQTRLASDAPTLGICLGAQLMARALGAKVYPGKQKELGWQRVELSEAGKQSPLHHLEYSPVLHWHGDTFDLPQLYQAFDGAIKDPSGGGGYGTHIFSHCGGRVCQHDVGSRPQPRVGAGT